jgi:hypothetical protein
MSNRAKKAIISIAVLNFSVACAGEDTANPGGTAAMSEREIAQHQADLDFGLITKVVVGQGHVVKFMEPSPGALAISETFDLGNRRPLNLGQPLDFIWDEIAADEAMPEALARLAEEQRLQLEAGPISDSPEDVVPAEDQNTSGQGLAGVEPQRALDEKHFTSSFVHFEVDQQGCKTLGSSLKWRWCWGNRTGSFNEAVKSGEAIASAVSVYSASGTAVDFCHRMGSDQYCAWVNGGQGNSFVGHVSANFFGVRVDQDLGSRLSPVVIGTNWHWGGSISGNYANAFTFGGYSLER